MKNIILFLSLMVTLAACNSDDSLHVTVDSENTRIDSIYITQLITNKIISQLSVKDKAKSRIQRAIENPTIGSIKTKDGGNGYLTIMSSKRDLNIIIKADSTIGTDNVGDSLLNYLWNSTNEFIVQNNGLIFTSSNSDTLLHIFENFRAERIEKIDQQSTKLTSEEKELLHYQNDARVYSFLFYLGRIIKNYPPEHSFYRFIENIENNNKLAKTLPQNLLYKHEIGYLLENDSLTSISDFTKYIERQTSKTDLSDFLKSTYISEIIESPSYWERHQKLFNSHELKKEIEKEQSNPYFELIHKSSKSFFSSQKGVEAYNFTAERMDGSQIKLSDLKGKIVFIDSWASWCGPCIIHRPHVLELAEKYKGDSRVEILMISMDASREDWNKFLTKRNQQGNSGDYIIENGMQTEYGEKFNVKSIPKYILIDELGMIINSNLSEPGEAVSNMIEAELDRISKSNDVKEVE